MQIGRFSERLTVSVKRFQRQFIITGTVEFPDCPLDISAGRYRHINAVTGNEIECLKQVHIHRARQGDQQMGFIDPQGNHIMFTGKLCRDQGKDGFVKRVIVQADKRQAEALCKRSLTALIRRQFVRRLFGSMIKWRLLFCGLKRGIECIGQRVILNRGLFGDLFVARSHRASLH